MEKIAADQQQTVITIIIVAVMILVAALVGIGIYGRRKKRDRARELADRELAVIVEEVRLTAGGLICIALLVLTLIGAFSAYAGAKTVFQQIEAGVSLIAACILFGLGIALGRSRTYRIYRSENREPL